MPVDLDQYREPSRDPAVLAARREALIDQLGWLSDEAEALGQALTDLPDWMLTETALPGERSAKALFAHLAALDRVVYPLWIERLVTRDTPALDDLQAPDGEAFDQAASDRPLDELLAEIRTQRATLVAALQSVPDGDWDRTATLDGETLSLYDLALRIVRHDADSLRTLAYRLHEAKLAQRS